MDGIIIVNKPKGITSQGVVSKIKKILNEKKVGHTGTLDPLATGVLPILVGNATKLSKYLIEHDKTYIATLKLGIQTDTGDLEGTIIQNKDIANNIDNKRIEEIFKQFLGKQKQIPPMYSAIKIDGKKLYEYARKEKNDNNIIINDIKVNVINDNNMNRNINNNIYNKLKDKIKPRDIEIYSLKLIKYNKEEKEIEFEVKCSKGTYIRTLCEDIAKKLDTVGFMKTLIRTKVDRFSINESYTLEEIENKKFNLINIENVFTNIEKIDLNDRKKVLFLNGVMLTYKLKDGLYNIYSNNEYIGIGVIKSNLLKRDIIVI